MRPAKPMLAASIALAGACSSSGAPAPEITSLAPPAITQGDAAELRVLGRHFVPRVHASFDGQSSADSGFELRVEGVAGSHPLEDVVWRSESELDARAPSTLASGSYDLVLLDPDGLTAGLAAALDVVGVECTSDEECDDGDACTTSESCVANHCIAGQRDKDADGDEFVDGACGGSDCDDDPAMCGALCNVDQLEGPFGSSACSDAQDNDCDALVDADETSCAAGCVSLVSESFDYENTASRDTWLDESARNDANGGSPNLRVGGAPGAELRSLLFWDIAPLPPTADVVAARIVAVDIGSSPDASIACYRITQTWDEDGASWQRAFTSGSNGDWGSPGGDFDPQATDVTLVGVENNPSWDVTAAVRAMHASQFPNDGFLLRDVDPSSSVFQLHSNESNQKNKLRVDYCLP